MTVRDDILEGTREAIAEIAEGETWSLRAITSDPGVSPPTYAEDAVLDGARLAKRTSLQEYDDTIASHVRRERGELTVPDAPGVHYGDKIVGTVGAPWSFEGIVQSGIGFQRWAIMRDVPLVQGSATRGRQ